MLRRFVVSVVGVFLGTALVLQGFSGPAGASVANPGAVTFAIDSLTIAIGSINATYNTASAPG